MKNNLLYSHPGREEECLQAINRSNNISSTVWSPPQALAMPVVSSPIMSCVTTTTSLGSNNMLDFSYYNNKPVESGNQNTDQSSEGHTTDTRGVVSNKKAKVQPSPSQPPLKVRKEKLGDRITALHQLVSPFGKIDTASVLLEAIGYIRFLQSQIEGAVSVRFQIHETSLCIVCSHLASGGRQGDEKYRNSNVTEVLSRTTFPRDHSHFKSVIKRLQELAAQAKQEANGNESNWFPREEEVEEPTQNANVCILSFSAKMLMYVFVLFF